jgi:DNA polymerase-3 subunit gamma/tau
VSYKVLAQRWRPQRFDDVIGQRAVTQTLRNAIAGDRLGQSYIFAGPRGVGKTTTARILARVLNCEQGPTAEPCGQCDACVEIAAGRDMDVLEMDAATHTQVDKVRDIIISGLSVAPVRDRKKIFIIDEVHRLSPQAFDALLKSIEEPPPHVVFMMATTEIDKVPATIQSRSQVFELKMIGVRQIADQLKTIAAAEQIAIDEAAVMLIARAGDGSMRDAQSAFDQVIAFAGTTITAEDVSTVLGLVRRELMLEMAEAVAREDGAAAFRLVDRAVEAGYELRQLLRELSRLARDLLVIKIDPSRLMDPEIATESERDRLKAVAALFSPEDLMRAFEVISKGELDIRSAVQPRFHVEMTLLRWMHLGKLVPLGELIESMEKGAPAARGAQAASRPASTAPPRPSPSAPPARNSAVGSRPSAPAAAGRPVPRNGGEERGPVKSEARTTPGGPPTETSGALPIVQPVPADRLKEAFLEEVRRVKKFFYGTVIAQAQGIEIEGDRIVVTFAPQHRALKSQLEQTRPLLETLATQLADRKMSVVAEEAAPGAPPAGAAGKQPGAATAPSDDRKAALREQALADSGVQAMLDVFAAEIRDVEEM